MPLKAPLEVSLSKEVDLQALQLCLWADHSLLKKFTVTCSGSYKQFTWNGNDHPHASSGVLLLWWETMNGTERPCACTYQSSGLRSCLVWCRGWPLVTLRYGAYGLAPPLPAAGRPSSSTITWSGLRVAMFPARGTTNGVRSSTKLQSLLMDKPGGASRPLFQLREGRP